MRIRLTDWGISEEQSEHENALRSRGLRNGCGISKCRGSLRSGKNGAGCRLQAMGCAFAFPNPRNGPSDGTRKILAQCSGAGWRHFRFSHRHDRRIRSIVGPLSVGRAWQTMGLENRPGIFPDYVRADHSLLRVRSVFRGVDYEWAAATASSDF